MYLNFMVLNEFLFELSCKNTHTYTHTHMDALKVSDEYSIVAFSNNATVKMRDTIIGGGGAGAKHQRILFDPSPMHFVSSLTFAFRPYRHSAHIQLTFS